MSIADVLKKPRYFCFWLASISVSHFFITLLLFSSFLSPLLCLSPCIFSLNLPTVFSSSIPHCHSSTSIRHVFTPFPQKFASFFQAVVRGVTPFVCEVWPWYGVMNKTHLAHAPILCRWALHQWFPLAHMSDVGCPQPTPETKHTHACAHTQHKHACTRTHARTHAHTHTHTVFRDQHY